MKLSLLNCVEQSISSLEIFNYKIKKKKWFDCLVKLKKRKRKKRQEDSRDCFIERDGPNFH